MKKTNLAIIFLLIIGLASAYAYRRYSQSGPSFNQNQAGKAAPDFSVPDTKGGDIKLSDYKGKLVLLNFWASWCPPCRAEIPGFINVQDTYKDKSFTFIGVAVEDKNAANNFAKEMGINYPVGYGIEPALAAAGKYGNPDGGLPYSVLISPKQEILYIHSGFLSEDKLKKLIEKNLP
jgi:peroxiredoxin